MLKDLFYTYVLTGGFLSVCYNTNINVINVLNVFCFLYLAYNVYKDKAFFEREYLDMRMKMYYD